jgi:hypothetical protein
MGMIDERVETEKGLNESAIKFKILELNCGFEADKRFPMLEHKIQKVVKIFSGDEIFEIGPILAKSKAGKSSAAKL